MLRATESSTLNVRTVPLYHDPFRSENNLVMGEEQVLREDCLPHRLDLYLRCSTYKATANFKDTVLTMSKSMLSWR